MRCIGLAGELAVSEQVVADESGEVDRDIWTLFCRQGSHCFCKLGSCIGGSLSKDVLSC